MEALQGCTKKTPGPSEIRSVCKERETIRSDKEIWWVDLAASFRLYRLRGFRRA